MSETMERDILLAHIDGPVDYIVDDMPRLAATRWLLERGPLRTDGSVYPRQSFLSDAGRAVLAKHAYPVNAHTHYIGIMAQTPQAI